MQSLITRFHLLVFGVTLAIAGVGYLQIPEAFLFPAHFTRSTADWLWPRDIALLTPPALQLGIMLAFFLLGRALTKNHFAKTQHILEPAIRLVLMIIAGCQLGLLLLGIGSDLDFFRVTAGLLAAALFVLAAMLFEAERHSYGGMRMPWHVVSDRAWAIVHRATALLAGLCAVGLGYSAWSSPGPGALVVNMAAVFVGLPLFAAALTLVTRRV
jgi:uncharacterized membrane protein